MSSTTRTFIAVEVPKGPCDQLGRLQRALGPEAPGVRWVSAEAFHITLAFLGDVPHGDLAAVCRTVGTSVGPSPRFELRLEGLGAFPILRKPRVIWVGAAGPGVAPLMDLQKAIGDAVDSAGYPPDERFHPHVTIGRLKPGRRRPLDLSSLMDRYATWSPGSVWVSEVITFSSTLTPEGPVYAPLARSALTGRPKD
jgi:2'-5' RNA ligase